MTDAVAAPASAPAAEVEARVLEVVRGLAEETGGPRAAHAVASSASLEREIGLGSLEWHHDGEQDEGAGNKPFHSKSPEVKW